MKPLTICFVTARQDPKFDWFAESLTRNVEESQVSWSRIRVVVVDFYRQYRNRAVELPCKVQHVVPKPTVWQGPSRLTKQDWWAMSNARNTGLCLADTEWIAFLDDRCVLQPGWMDAVLRAQRENYVVAGTYDKRTGVTAHNGVIKHAGIIIGEDSRIAHAPPTVAPCDPRWLFGCSFALPTDWMLTVNGFDETCDGCSGEDSIFGVMLANAGYPIRFDPKMKIVEDRTPGALGAPMIRRDKGVSPNDKSHALIALLKDRKASMHHWNLRQIRKSVLDGQPFPEAKLPTKDWFDGQPLSEMEPG